MPREGGATSNLRWSGATGSPACAGDDNRESELAGDVNWLRASMKLTPEEEAMRAGELGSAVQWAIEHQIRVGDYLGARDFVAVTQAHVMADTESLGVA